MFNVFWTYDSLESLCKVVERRRVKTIRVNISGKADRAKSLFVLLFRELITFDWLLIFLKDKHNV